MADISAIFGILLALGIAFPGLLAAFRLLFPAGVERAALRLQATPWSCFWLGALVTFIAAIPILTLAALPVGPAKLASALLAALVLASGALGAAGLAGRMGAEIQRLGSQPASPLGAFVRGALALELAAFFPVIGWLLVMPVAVIVSLGAAVFALLNWMPASRKSGTAESLQPGHEAA